MNKKKIMSIVASFSMLTTYVMQPVKQSTEQEEITSSSLTVYADDAVAQEEYVVGASIALGGALKVNIKFNCEITEEDNWTINEETFATTGRIVSYAVSAKDFMNDIIIKHGTKTVHTFSVADMLTQYQLNGKTKNISSALERYCAAAKAYFGNGTVEDYSDSFESIKAEIGSHEVEMGDGYYASSLLLKSSTILRHYYTKPIDGANATSNGYYYIEEAVSAHQYSSFDSYCVNDYIFKVLSNPSADTNLKNLCAALYYYGNAAFEYAMKPENIDTDGDGLFDDLEIKINYNPYLEDSDGNSIPDGDEDYDDDGISNIDELHLTTCPYASDSDYDGINDFDELNVYLTDPNNEDSDGDGIIDGDELLLQTNLNNAETNGVKDNENTKEYQFSASSEQTEDFNAESQMFKFSFDIKAAGAVDRHVKVAETGYRNAINENTYIIGKSPCISYDDKMKVENVSVYFAMQDGYDADISKYTVFYYWEGYNLLIPVETYYDEENKTVYAHNIFAGTYCLVNTDELRDSLGKVTAPKAAPPRLNAPDIEETGDNTGISVGATTIWNGHEYFLITFDEGKEYPEAVSICRKYGGYPATITSSEENDVVDGVSDWNEIWLGAGFAKPSKLEYVLTWCTGEIAVFECWRSNFFIYSISEDDHVGSFFGLWSVKKSDAKLNAVVCEREISEEPRNIYDGLTFKPNDWELDPDPNADSDGDGIPDRQELSPFDEGTFGADGSYTPAQYRRYIEVANDLGIHVNEKIGSDMADIRTPSYSSDPHKKDSDDDDYPDYEDGKPFDKNEDLIEILALIDKLCIDDAKRLEKKYESKGKRCRIHYFWGYDSFVSRWKCIGDMDMKYNYISTDKYFFNVTDVILIAHGIPGAIILENDQYLIPENENINSHVFGIDSISNCRRFDKLEMLICYSDKKKESDKDCYDKTIAEAFFSHFPSIKKVYAFDWTCGLTAELDWVGTWKYDDPIIYKFWNKPTSYTYYMDLDLPKGQTCYSRTSDYNDDLYPGLCDMVLFFNFNVEKIIGDGIEPGQVSKKVDADYYGFDPVLEG